MVSSTSDREGLPLLFLTFFLKHILFLRRHSSLLMLILVITFLLAAATTSRLVCFCSSADLNKRVELCNNLHEMSPFK